MMQVTSGQPLVTDQDDDDSISDTTDPSAEDAFEAAADKDDDIDPSVRTPQPFSGSGPDQDDDT